LTFLEVFVYFPLLPALSTEESYSLPTKQTTNKVTQNCWNYSTIT